jgi:type II secretory pathway component PulJ
MPQVVLLAAIGGALYAGYRALARVSEAMTAELRRTEEAAARRRTDSDATAARDLGTLEFDPSSGVYKPTSKS